MQQLSGLDNLFLTGEDERQHMHIAALGIYDPSTAQGGEVRFKTMLDFFSDRAEEVPFFRRRLVKVPFDLDRPYWLEDSDIDIEYHVRHIALPAPGDWRQLMIQVARIHSRALDSAKPMWEAYVIGGLDNIEGLETGSFALYLKMHHAAVDGQAASQLIQLLHTLTPEYEPYSNVTAVVKDRQPSGIELTLRTLMHRGQQLVDATRLAGEMGRLGANLGAKYGPELIDGMRNILAEKLTVNDTSPAAARSDRKRSDSKTRFDAQISPHRVVDAISIPLDACATIREHIPDATINDIFMATISGALRKYLQLHNELPSTSINSMMPMATTGAQKNTESANNVASTIVSLHSDIDDPIARLYEIKKSTTRSKALQDDIGRDLLPKLLDVVPDTLASGLLDLAIQDRASLTTSNVRGPDIPLYLAGAKCQMIVPVSVPYDKMGLNITGFSYLGTLWICITACRDMLPDPGVFSQFMHDSFDELKHAALAAGQKSKAKSRTRRTQPRKAARKTGSQNQPARSNKKTSK